MHCVAVAFDFDGRNRVRFLFGTWRPLTGRIDEHYWQVFRESSAAVTVLKLLRYRRELFKNRLTLSNALLSREWANYVCSMAATGNRIPRDVNPGRARSPRRMKNSRKRHFFFSPTIIKRHIIFFFFLFFIFVYLPLPVVLYFRPMSRLRRLKHDHRFAGRIAFSSATPGQTGTPTRTRIIAPA